MLIASAACITEIDIVDTVFANQTYTISVRDVPDKDAPEEYWIRPFAPLYKLQPFGGDTPSTVNLSATENDTSFNNCHRAPSYTYCAWMIMTKAQNTSTIVPFFSRREYPSLNVSIYTSAFPAVGNYSRTTIFMQDVITAKSRFNSSQFTLSGSCNSTTSPYYLHPADLRIMLNGSDIMNGVETKFLYWRCASIKQSFLWAWQMNSTCWSLPEITGIDGTRVKDCEMFAVIGQTGPGTFLTSVYLGNTAAIALRIPIEKPGWGFGLILSIIILGIVGFFVIAHCVLYYLQKKRANNQIQSMPEMTSTVNAKDVNSIIAMPSNR
jgi:hypothetical protein